MKSKLGIAYQKKGAVSQIGRASFFKERFWINGSGDVVNAGGQSRTPPLPRSGYRGSDLVQWHDSEPLPRRNRTVSYRG